MHGCAWHCRHATILAVYKFPQHEHLSQSQFADSLGGFLMKSYFTIPKMDDWGEDGVVGFTFAWEAKVPLQISTKVVQPSRHV